MFGGKRQIHAFCLTGGASCFQICDEQLDSTRRVSSTPPEPYSAREAATLRRHPLIKLYTAPTPNGWKVTIMLEELIEACEETTGKKGTNIEIKGHPDSIFAGAIGAAIWGAFRYDKLAKLDALPLAS